MNGQSTLRRDPVDPGFAHNIPMRSHSDIMHYARYDCKRLLHDVRRYALCMSTPNERLRQARSRMFESAKEAAEAMGIPNGTYTGHENGHRGFPASRAPKYARKFGVTEEWLLYGKGSIDDRPDDRVAIPNIKHLETMIEDAMDELPIEATRADYVRVVASSLHDQLEQLRVVGGPRSEPASLHQARKARDKTARSQTPTTRSAKAG